MSCTPSRHLGVHRGKGSLGLERGHQLRLAKAAVRELEVQLTPAQVGAGQGELGPFAGALDRIQGVARKRVGAGDGDPGQRESAGRHPDENRGPGAAVTGRHLADDLRLSGHRGPVRQLGRPRVGRGAYAFAFDLREQHGAESGPELRVGLGQRREFRDLARQRDEFGQLGVVTRAPVMTAATPGRLVEQFGEAFGAPAVIDRRLHRGHPLSNA